jgi:hypothetical protein
VSTVLSKTCLSKTKYVIGIIAQAAVFYGLKKMDLLYAFAGLKVRYGPGRPEYAVAGPSRKGQALRGQGKDLTAFAVKGAAALDHGRIHAGIPSYRGVFIANLLNFHCPAHAPPYTLAVLPDFSRKY